MNAPKLELFQFNFLLLLVVSFDFCDVTYARLRPTLQSTQTGMGVNKQGMVPVEYSEVTGGQGAPTGQIQVKGYKRFESLPLAPKVTE